MRQVIQNIRTGQTQVIEVPPANLAPGYLLIRTRFSLISTGTERMLIEFGRANWFDKARQQPDKVRQVIEKAGTDGIIATLDAVHSKLDQPMKPGYCNVGVVVGVGGGVSGFTIGDRVVSNGSHADVVSVPCNLCARIPQGVTDEQAAFTILGAIGLQGIRLANPTLGECVAVIGLGLIGLLSVQLLRAQGCRVLGIDPDPLRSNLARQMGAEVTDSIKGQDTLAMAKEVSRGRGVDAVIITASTTSSDPIRQAAHMCRQRGRIVLVGVAGLELSRADFYEKELTFQVSCSYGPGRYDPSYEERGHDYPVGFVRWTEQRNFEAVLDQLAAGALKTDGLVSHRFVLARAPEAYDLLTSKNPTLGILLDYETGPFDAEELRLGRYVILAPLVPSAQPGRIGFIGAGNYASRVLIPAFKTAGADLRTIASAGGVSAVHCGKKFGFANATTSVDEVMADPSIDSIVIATRHNSHARFALAALRAGKNVFVEKPLCLTLDELGEIEGVLADTARPYLMVGFNRRFSPHARKARDLLASYREPKAFIMTVNAGSVPADHWTQIPDIGGGRIVGEGCHFIDLLRFLAGAPIAKVDVRTLGTGPVQSGAADKATITLSFADGSLGTIHYLANGHRSVAKERLEVFCGGRVLMLDNFRSLKGHGWPGFSRMASWRQDKGQVACALAFLDAIRRGCLPPVPIEETLEISRVSIIAQAHCL
jgi:predicted dehydrogenase/threonine dehydrogenase-like Zn-dependent dehydrogenase